MISPINIDLVKYSANVECFTLDQIEDDILSTILILNRDVERFFEDYLVTHYLTLDCNNNYAYKITLLSGFQYYIIIKDSEILITMSKKYKEK